MRCDRIIETAPFNAGPDRTTGSDRLQPPNLLPVAHATPLRILVVEDDALIGMLLGDMLELMGHEVCAIEMTEAAAVRSAANCTPNMLIVDANLSQGSGLAAVDQILRHVFVPHVFVTGDPNGVVKLRPGEVVISKPFTEATLAQAINRARGVV